jgi:proteasome lid subunit RPN8/RPN11
LARQKVTAIRRKVLNMLLAASRDNQANTGEFICALRARNGIIEEFLLIPGTISSDGYAIFSLHNLPIDLSIVGTAHSHPPGSEPRPSEQDMKQFSQFGQVQIIMGYPYTMDSWKAYSRAGEEILLNVI